MNAEADNRPTAGDTTMRWILTSITLLCGIGLSGSVVAGGPEQFAGYVQGGNCCDECDPCAGGGWRGNRRNRDLGFNCGCNGSYKFPVPPLYTYHWPGMYSAQLMTDYHSPWRFPPLKPYMDETMPEVIGSTSVLRRVQPTAAVAGAARSARPSSFSDHVERSLR
jgi:hypothetical protein